MKKLLSVIAVAGMFAFVACGPSAEQKQAAADKIIADSIAVADSIAKVGQAAAEQLVKDSIAAVDAKRIQDSIAAAEAKPVKKGKK